MIHDTKFNFNSKIKYNFNGGELTSDAGLLLIKEFLSKLGFHSLLEQTFNVQDDFAIRKHTNQKLCLQSLLFMIAGYHNQGHSDALRNDPAFQAFMDSSSLASQPMISRFMNRLTSETERQFELINEQLLDIYYQINPPEHFIFDIDSTHFQTYGKQEGHAFNGHYQTDGFHPLMVFEGMTGYCLRSQLRPGNFYSSRDVASFLRPVLVNYQNKFSNKYRIVRGDSGFATPELYELCDETDTHFIVRLKENKNLLLQAKHLEKLVINEERIQEEQIVLGEFMYQAKSWSKPRRIVVQVRRRAEQMSIDHMFIVTNMKTSNKNIIAFYAKRGKMENFIKECKNGFRMDKVSHKAFIVNANRMQISLLAYNLINGFRQLVLPESFCRLQIETLRNKLFKVAAKKVKKARQITFKICSHFAYQDIWEMIHKNIQFLKIQKE
jgi:Transposase DDE domain.